MSAKPQHNGLSADDRSKIRSAILSSREILESEFERQLERYGVYDDERVPLSKLGHLSLQDRETRREINAALERELKATEDYQRAYRNYVREATKEYLNRYVGLKTIEARGLVTETLTAKAEYGNRSYLHYTVDEIAGELTDAPDDGLGVALDLAFQEIGAEIQILFEDTDYTAIEPEFTVRRDIFEELDELDDDAWAADEAIGWVYQYFGEKEREEIDEQIQEHNYKVQDTDIATKTQLFTPRYIVEYLVDNSLGRLWLEMYGDETAINNEDNCFYLTPVEESLTDREQKDPREITVLDPACGGGHFLFYAFDVLYEMYQERTDVIGSQIPREILKHNLYGIDIDPGAVQLAALALYLKAKTIEPDVTIDQLNIVSADAVLINGERKEQVLDEVELDIEERLIEQIWTSFEHVREWGSLVNVKERVEELIEEEREEFEQLQQQGQARFTSSGDMTTQSSFITEHGGEMSWAELKDRLIDEAREIANKALEQNSVIDELFAGEVEKSVELLDVLLNDYDVVVANPPYLQSSKMGATLKEFVSSNFVGKRDLYGAFIERCLDFSRDDGYVAMVTQENFMFTYSFKGLRELLMESSYLVEAAHLARYSFDQQKDRYTVPFVMRSCSLPDDPVSKFYRMTHEQEEYEHYEDKITGLKHITNELRSGKTHDDVFIVNPNRFKEIGRQPFIYWFGQEILDLFKEYPQISDVADVNAGLQTGDDDKFVRCWWEINSDTIGEKYIWYVLSGSDAEYYDSPEKVVLWENGGEEILDYDGSHARNTEYYGKEGITFRDFSKFFTARIHPKNHIFSNASYFIYCNEINKYSLLGQLCSSLTRFIAQGLNPSFHFMVGDVKRIPTKNEFNQSDSIQNFVKKAIELRKKQCQINEVKREFDGQVLLRKFNSLKFYEELLEADIQVAHGKIDELIFDEYRISDDMRSRVVEDLPSNLAQYPQDIHEDLDGCEFQDQVPTREFTDEKYENLKNQIKSLDADSLRSYSEELEISPYTIANLRYQHGLYSNDENKEMAGRLVSFYLGCIFGRWENIEEIDPVESGIVVFDEQFDNNVSDHIHSCIDATFEEVYETENKIEELLNKDMTKWLRENFFRYHHTKEYRRRGQRIPIYWQLESQDGAFSCFIYYHSMNSDTLPKLRGRFVDAKIENLENRLQSLENKLENVGDQQSREIRSELEELEEQLNDVKDFGERLDALIDEGFEPDFEAGIWKNIQKVDKHDLLQTELDKL